MEIFSALGLSSASGLNAYIPLLALSLLDRYTDVVELPATWAWLSRGWVIVVLLVLLTIELVADKVPVVDSINDAIQSLIRPASGGIAFSSAALPAATADGSFPWGTFIAGLVVALGVHLTKMTSRPLVNASTATLATPFVSAGGDMASVGLTVTALFVPILAVVLFVVVIIAMWVLVSRARRTSRRARRGA